MQRRMIRFCPILLQRDRFLRTTRIRNLNYLLILLAGNGFNACMSFLFVHHHPRTSTRHHQDHFCNMVQTSKLNDDRIFVRTTLFQSRKSPEVEEDNIIHLSRHHLQLFEWQVPLFKACYLWLVRQTKNWISVDD